MDIMNTTNGAGLLDILDTLRGVAEKLPKEVDCRLYPSGIHLFRPDEGEISAIYGREITQAPFDDEYDERFVCVDGVKVIWLAPKEAGNGTEV